MTVMEHLLDTVIHKRYILEVGEVMINYLIENGREADAIKLAKRLIVHDDSKTRDEEIVNFASITEGDDNMRDPNVLISDDVRKSIEMHWKNNRHHPEHFDDYHKMNDIDIMEMVCDWYSRSLQKHTDFKNFVITRQANRFHFDDEFYIRVLTYCEVLLKNKKVTNK